MGKKSFSDEGKNTTTSADSKSIIKDLVEEAKALKNENTLLKENHRTQSEKLKKVESECAELRKQSSNTSDPPKKTGRRGSITGYNDKLFIIMQQENNKIKQENNEMRRKVEEAQALTTLSKIQMETNAQNANTIQQLEEEAHDLAKKLKVVKKKCDKKVNKLTQEVEKLKTQRADLMESNGCLSASHNKNLKMIRDLEKKK